MRSRLGFAALSTVLVVVMAACGGGGDGGGDDGDGQGNGDTGGNGGAQTTAQSGSGGNIDTTYGSATYEISGADMDRDGELGFVPPASVYSEGNWYLSFTSSTTDTGTVLTISLDPEVANVTFGDGQVVVIGTKDQCDFSDVSQDSNEASGTITCTNVGGIKASGASVTEGIDMTIDFEART
jgi:hypothetical protein